MKHALTGALLCLMLGSPSIHAADWSDCRRTKLESLQLQKALRKNYLTRGYRSRSAMRDAMRRKDAWLWRQCRRYSSDLRELAVRSR